MVAIITGLILMSSPVEKRAVMVYSDHMLASGVMVSTNRLLTVRHANPKGVFPIYVSQDEKLPECQEELSEPAILITQSKKSDLALYEFRGDSRSTVKLAKAVIGEEVYTYGFPNGAAMYIPGKVMRITDDQIIIHMICLQGTSGAGVYNQDHKLIGIVAISYGKGNNICGAIPIKHIKKIMRPKNMR